jgi:hypothetical protein
MNSFHLHNVVKLYESLSPCPPSISFKALSIIAGLHVDGTTSSLISRTKLMVLLHKITFATHPMCHFHLGSMYNMQQQTFINSKQPFKHSLINPFSHYNVISSQVIGFYCHLHLTSLAPRSLKDCTSQPTCHINIYINRFTIRWEN